VQQALSMEQYVSNLPHREKKAKVHELDEEGKELQLPHIYLVAR
jgi:hypothetical protein